MHISVAVNDYYSKLHVIHASVPKGSVLAHTLFFVYINSVLSSTSTLILSYADDCITINKYMICIGLCSNLYHKI